MTNLDQDSVALLILSWGATRAGVFPVNIQTVKLVLTQEGDHAADEGLTIGGRRHHSCEPGDGKTVRMFLPLLQVPIDESTDPRFITAYF